MTKKTDPTFFKILFKYLLSLENMKSRNDADKLLQLAQISPQILSDLSFSTQQAIFLKSKRRVERQLKLDKGLRSFLLMNLKKNSKNFFEFPYAIKILEKNLDDICGWEESKKTSFLEDQTQKQSDSNLFNISKIFFLHGLASDYLDSTENSLDVEIIKKTFSYVDEIKIKGIQGAGHWLHSSHLAKVGEEIRNFI